MQQKYVYFFDECSGKTRRLLGSKGANLADLRNLGLPAPDGFIVTTEASLCKLPEDKALIRDCLYEIGAALSELEERTGNRLSDTRHPLLLALRPGARVPMPGIMDTVLFIGLNDESVWGLEKETSSHFAWNQYQKFLRRYACAVMGVREHYFDQLLDRMLHSRGVLREEELRVDDLRALVTQFRELIQVQTGDDVPADPTFQLFFAVRAAMLSWNSPRACAYRRDNHIPDNWGVGVTVQRMVFKNRNEDGGAGIAYTRDPVSGARTLSGEFLFRAGCEELSEGMREPESLSRMAMAFPEAYEQLVRSISVLENRYSGLRDVSFVVEYGTLFLLRAHADMQTAENTILLAQEQSGEAGSGAAAREQGSAGGEANAAGFDPSLDYTAYPTLSLLPETCRNAVQALKTDWAAGKNEYGRVAATRENWRIFL